MFKNNMFKSRKKKIAGIFLISFLFLSGVFFAFQGLSASWIPPSSPPPTSNVKSPIYNEGTLTNPTLNLPFKVDNDIKVQRVCDENGDNCIDPAQIGRLCRVIAYGSTGVVRCPTGYLVVSLMNASNVLVNPATPPMSGKMICCK